NNMPIEPMLNQTTQTLAEGQKVVKEANAMLVELNKVMASKEFQNLPHDLQKTLQEMNRAMQGFQPGSPAYNKMVDNMQRLDQVLREVQPLLRTLNNKSNALVFEAEPTKDVQPKGVKK
ncbi:MAG: paraquat-inducible protein B, partial [Providencia sp.]|nr:paraquat-inducible protein B [Providencia sp.]